MSAFGQERRKSNAPKKVLKRVELDEWFQRNLRALESTKTGVAKEMLKSNTNIRSKIEHDSAQLRFDIDPIFCKHYGV